MTSPVVQIEKVPPPSHRHAAPSGPWPWMDLSSEVDPEQLTSELPPVPDPCDHTKCEGDCWKRYPISRFPNWTDAQVRRAKIKRAVEEYDRSLVSKVLLCDVSKKGLFETPKASGLTVDENTKDDFWNAFLSAKREDHIRVRSIFVENMTGPVLQMLGARYNIEPFFFSSALNWIPARYQEDMRPKTGDHITISLTFLTTMRNPNLLSSRAPTFESFLSGSPRSSETDVGTLAGKGDEYTAEQVIDTQAPLTISSSGRILLLDLLAIHMIRKPDSSTIISYHPTRTTTTPPEAEPDPSAPQQHAHHVFSSHWRTRHSVNVQVPPNIARTMNAAPAASPSRRGSGNTDAGTTAARLHQRVRFAGQSVYWQNIFTQSQDPTFVLLTFLWHALYAWDEALEVLYEHVCSLEGRVISTSDMRLTTELHIIRAHHLYYSALLDDFRKSVLFVRDTLNPAMDADDITEDERQRSRDLLEKECGNLLSEIERLKKGRKMQDQRLKNVMNLVFSSVNIEDSKRMQRLTEAAVRDSAAMKQIAYLTMIFLPASFVAAAFGMNIRELIPDDPNGVHNANGTLAHYLEAVIPFTFVTVWVIIAFQSKHFYEEASRAPFWKRLAWPYGVVQMFARSTRRRAMDAFSTFDSTSSLNNHNHIRGA